MNGPKLSVVIPTLNEEGNIQSLVERIDATLQKSHISYELIFVDDHSTDETGEVIRTLAQQFPISLYIKKGECGKAESLIEGFSYASGEIFAIIDADLQYPPEALPDMVSQVVNGDDIVVARRGVHHTSLLRQFASKMFALVFARWLHRLNCDVQSGMKVFRSRIVKEIPVSARRWTFDLEFLLSARNLGYSIGNFDIVFEHRYSGKSKVSFVRAATEIGVNAVQLRFRRYQPTAISSNLSNMVNAGVAYKKKRFITHTTLPHSISAIKSFAPWQKMFFFGAILTVLIGVMINPMATGIAVTGLLSTIYFIDVLFNFYLVRNSLRRTPEITFTDDELKFIDDHSLPVYSILCPLYKESHVLPHFLKAIEKIEWPKNKLDVILLLEEDDQETLEVAEKLMMPSYVRTVVVPHSEPKTKPKACNYGLGFARGEYLVIYDAEDIPDPWQLKKAYLGFQTVPNNVACLQAKLNYHNPHQNILTRLFTAEYSLWFDVTLTGLQTMNTYIPLGGTSNHFRTTDLQRLEGWDPFNVTEDCDLGIRLFRLKSKTAIIDSVTLEEANSNVQNWVRQRSRWIKGYMQTYLVHMRHPFHFFKTNKIHGVIFQLVVGGKIAFTLINPFLWLATISYFVLYSIVGETIESLFPPIIFFMAATSLLFGNFMFLYYYMIGCVKREQWQLVKYIYFVPFYWLLTSLAAYIALYQLITKPHFWEKTNHGLHLVAVRPAVITAFSQFTKGFFADVTSSVVKLNERATTTANGASYFFRKYSWHWDEQGPHLSHQTPLTYLRPVMNVMQTYGQRVTYLANELQIVAKDFFSRLQNTFDTDRESVALSENSEDGVVPTSPVKLLYKKISSLLEKHQLLSSGSVLVVAMMAGNVLNLLFNVFLGRVLTFTDFGLIAFISTLWFVVQMFTGALGTTVNHQSAYLTAAKNNHSSYAFFRATLRRANRVAIISSVIWVFLLPISARFFNIANPIVLLAFTPMLSAGVIAAVSGGFIQGNLLFRTTAVITLTEAATKFSFALILVSVGLASYAYLAIPFSVIASSTVALYATKHFGFTYRPRTTVALSKKFYLASLLSSISGIVFLSVDMILVKHYLPPETAGQYALLALVGKMVFFAGSLPNAFMVSLVSRDEGLGKDTRTTLYRILGGTVFLISTAMLILIPFGYLIIPALFGAKAMSILPYLSYYLPAIALFTTTNVLVSYHLTKKHYAFPVVALAMSCAMAGGIIASHGSIHDVAEVILVVSVIGFSAIAGLHWLEARSKSIVRNLIDLFDVFNTLPFTPPDALYVRKILIFNWRDTRHSFAGGAEVYIHEMAKQWVRQGHYVTTFCGNDGKTPRNDVVDGIHIVRRGGFYFVYVWAFIYYMLRFRGSYDVIIDCHNGVPFFTPLYTRKPVFCLMHHVHQEVFRQSLSKPLSWFARFLEKNMMPLVYRNIRFITVSKSSKNDIENLGLARAGINIVHPGVNLNDLKPGDKSESPTVLYLGRLKAYKSIHVLLEAFRIVSVIRPDANLVVAGSGEEESKLRAHAEELGIADKVSFLGKVTEATKITLLQKAWMLVNPSMMEGWGITSIEANACGTPVIASNVPGLRDSVSNPHTGYLVSYGDSAAFADRMLKIIEDKSVRDSLVSSALAWAQNFDWKKTSHSFFAIIDEDYEQ